MTYRGSGGEVAESLYSLQTLIRPLRSQAIPQATTGFSVIGYTDGLKPREPIPGWRKVGSFPHGSEMWEPVRKREGQQPVTLYDRGKRQ